MSPTANLNTVPDNPEQLDQAVRTTTVRGWIALGLAAAAVIAAIVWSIVATIPRQVEATAVVSDPNSVHVVIAGGSGAVTFGVSAGDHVDKGEEVASIAKFKGGTEPVYAPVGGRVRDILITQGQGVHPGSPLFSIGALKPPPHPHVVTFLPGSEAVLYHQGASVNVELQDPAEATTTVVPARVSYVANVPSPLEAIALTVHSLGLAKQLRGDADEAVYRVVMRIEGGLGGQTVEGQVANVVNTYDRQHPIDLLFGETGE